MQVIIDEYGKLIVTIIGVIMFMTIFRMILYGPNYDGTGMNIVTKYRTDMVDLGIFSGDIGGRDISHTIGEGSNVKNVTYSPHFHPRDITESDSKQIGSYKIHYDPDSGSDYAEFTWNDAVDIFKPSNSTDTSTGIWLDDEQSIRFDPNNPANCPVPVTFSITYLRYEAVLTYQPQKYNTTTKMWEDDMSKPALTNPTPKYTSVVATDKFGNIQYEADGVTPKMRTQIMYKKIGAGGDTINQNESVKYRFELTKDHPIKINMKRDPITREFIKDMDDTTDEILSGGIAPRYLLTYRIDVGDKKAEYQTFLVEDDIINQKEKDYEDGIDYTT